MILISAANEHHQIEKTIGSLGIKTAQLSLTEMPYADYAWGDVAGNTIGIERKTFRDLVQSLNNGRLEVQLAGCLEAYSKVGLLVEGSFDDLVTEYDRLRLAIPAFLGRVQCLGVDVHRSEGAVDSGYVLTALYRNSQKPDHTTMRRYLRKKPVLWRPNPDVEVLLAIAKVGGVRLTVEAAGLLVKKFGSPYKVLKADWAQWMEIRGVGAKVAQGLREVLKK